MEGSPSPQRPRDGSLRSGREVSVAFGVAPGRDRPGAAPMATFLRRREKAIRRADDLGVRGAEADAAATLASALRGHLTRHAWLMCCVCGGFRDPGRFTEHVARCRAELDGSIGRIAQHRLCGLLHDPPPPQPTPAALGPHGAEERAAFNQDAADTFNETSVVCKGCRLRFHINRAAQHFEECNCEPLDGVGGPLRVRYAPPQMKPETEIAAALLAYSCCSVSMILLNKLVIDTFHLSYPMGLLFIQNAAALLLVMSAKRLGYCSYPEFDTKIVRRWLPLTLFFVAMLWTSMKSLQTMSVAVQTILKNFATILTALGDAYLFQKQLSLPVFGTFGLMVFGGFLGSASDKWVTAWGVFWTLANVATTVAYVLYMKALLGAVNQEIGRYGPVFYNNLLSLPFLFVAALPTFPALAAELSTAPAAAWFCLLCMIAVGSVMTFAAFWAMHVTSPTTYSVTGSLNKVPLSIFGMVLFGQYPSAAGALGIVCALGAGVWYTWLTRPQPKPPTEQETRL